MKDKPRVSPHRLFNPWPFAALALVLGCQAELGPRSDTGGGNGNGNSPNAGGPDDADVFTMRDPTSDDDGLPWPMHDDGTPSPLRRLSRTQIAKQLEVLTGVPANRELIPPDRRVGSGVLTTADLAFLAPQISELEPYFSAYAEQAAPTVLANTGCSETGAAQASCLAAWATSFMATALKRELTPEESSFVEGLMDVAVGQVEVDTSAVEDVLYMAFLSPSTVYLTQVGTEVAGRPEVRALTAREVAGRISFLASQTAPDAELLSAADAGLLQDPAVRLEHFERLWNTDAGFEAQLRFILEWLRVPEPEINNKDLIYRDSLPEGFEQSAYESAASAIREVLDGPNPDVIGLLTTTSYLSHDSLAPVIGDAEVNGEVSGDTPETNRNGMLMHPYVMAAMTKATGHSAFHIGLVLKEGLLCQELPEPPPNAIAMALGDVPDGLSMIEDLRYRSDAGPVCVSCHQLFNELGFAFMPFDPHGRWVKQDPMVGQPWELAGSLPMHQGEDVTFDSPGQLSGVLAEHPQVNGCFAQAAIEWAFSRRLTPLDWGLASAVNEVAQSTNGNVHEVFRSIVSSAEFGFVLTKEATF